MRIALSLIWSFILVGCGKPSNTSVLNKSDSTSDSKICTQIFAYGLSIHVAIPTGMSSKNLVVTVREGAYQENAQSSFGLSDVPQQFDFVAAGERPGNYSITASLPGLNPVTTSASVVSGADGCHVNGKSISLVLK